MWSLRVKSFKMGSILFDGKDGRERTFTFTPNTFTIQGDIVTGYPNKGGQPLVGESRFIVILNSMLLPAVQVMHVADGNSSLNVGDVMACDPGMGMISINIGTTKMAYKVGKNTQVFVDGMRVRSLPNFERGSRACFTIQTTNGDDAIRHLLIFRAK